MNGAYQMDGRGDGAGDDRLERELRGWLRTFDPGELPIAARLRVYEGIPIDAGFGGRYSRTTRTLGRLVGLAAGLAACALILVAWVADGMSSDMTGPGARVPPVTGLPGSNGIDVVGQTRLNADAFVALLVVASIGALVTLLPAIRRAFARLVVGREPAPVADPRPVRSWRTVPRPAWTIVGLSLAWNAWWLSQWHPADSDPITQLWRGGLVVSYAVGSVVTALAVIARYRLAERSSKLFVAGVLGSMLASVVGTVIPWTSLDETQFDIAVLVSSLLRGLWPVLLAAGVARRAGSVRTPPRWMTATILGALVVSVYIFVADAYWAFEPGPFLDMAINGIPRVLVPLSWLTIAWVGIDASRRCSRPWPWRLLAIGALGFLASDLLGLAFGVLNILWPSALDPTTASIWGVDVANWVGGPATLLSLGVAIGLVAGLHRPEISASRGDAVRQLARSEVLV